MELYYNSQQSFTFQFKQTINQCSTILSANYLFLNTQSLYYLKILWFKAGRIISLDLNFAFEILVFHKYFVTNLSYKQIVSMVWQCIMCRTTSSNDKQIYWLTVGPPGLANRYCKKCFPIQLLNFSKILSLFIPGYKPPNESETTIQAAQRQLKLHQQINTLKQKIADLEAQNVDLIHSIQSLKSPVKDFKKFYSPLCYFKEVQNLYNLPALKPFKTELYNLRLTAPDTEQYLIIEIANLIKQAVHVQCDLILPMVSTKINKIKPQITAFEKLINAQEKELKKDDVLSPEDIDQSLSVLKRKLNEKKNQTRDLEDCSKTIREIKEKNQVFRTLVGSPCKRPLKI